MSRKYNNAPLQEALCELRFPPEVSWDAAVPGVLYEKVSSKFPQRESRIITSFDMNQAVGEAKATMGAEERVLFWNRGKTALIQTGKRVLSINHLKDGYSWNHFRPMTQLAIESARETLSFNTINQIALQYINRCRIPHASINLEEWFHFVPNIGPGLPQKISAFLMACQFPCQDGKDICKVEIASAVTPQSGKESVFFLNLHYSRSPTNILQAEEILSWIETAHDEIEKIFENCITDRLREVFEVIP